MIRCPYEPIDPPLRYVMHDPHAPTQRSCLLYDNERIQHTGWVQMTLPGFERLLGPGLFTKGHSPIG